MLLGGHVVRLQWNRSAFRALCWRSLAWAAEQTAIHGFVRLVAGRPKTEWERPFHEHNAYPAFPWYFHAANREQWTVFSETFIESYYRRVAKLKPLEEEVIPVFDD